MFYIFALMLRFGNISSIDAVNGLYKVTFDEDQLVSSSLPYLIKNSKGTKRHRRTQSQEKIDHIRGTKIYEENYKN